MDFEWDERKRHSNLVKHGIDFNRVGDFAWETALVLPDTRRDYGEPRFRAFGLLDGLPHVIAFTVRGNAYRVIHMRRAHGKEMKRYVSKIGQEDGA